MKTLQEIRTDLLREVREQRKRKKEIKSNQYDQITHYLLDCAKHSISPQSYGPGVERMIIEKLSWVKEKSKTAGDAVAKSGESIEIKFSMASDKGITNYVQLRPHYSVDKYLLVSYDVEKDSFEIILVSKQTMSTAIFNFGGYAHGSKKNNGDITMHSILNNNYEYAIRPNVKKKDLCLEFLRNNNLIKEERYKWIKTKLN